MQEGTPLPARSPSSANEKCSATDDEAASRPAAASTTDTVPNASGVEASTELAAPGGKREREDEPRANAGERGGSAELPEAAGMGGGESGRTSEQRDMEEDAGVGNGAATSAKRQKTGDTCRGFASLTSLPFVSSGIACKAPRIHEHAYARCAETD